MRGMNVLRRGGQYGRLLVAHEGGGGIGVGRGGDRHGLRAACSASLLCLKFLCFSCSCIRLNFPGLFFPGSFPLLCLRPFPLI